MLKIIGMVNENTNSTTDFALINSTTENDYDVTVVTIASYCVSPHRQKCLLFLLTSITVTTLIRCQQRQNYFDACCLPSSLPVGCE